MPQYTLGLTSLFWLEIFEQPSSLVDETATLAFEGPATALGERHVHGATVSRGPRALHRAVALQAVETL